MIQKKIKNFNPLQITNSGQCFRWNRISDDSYSFIAFGKYYEIVSTPEGFIFSCDECDWENVLMDYFDFNTDYGSIGERIAASNDTYLIAAYSNGLGIRILKQDLFEVVISFIISQNNNIPRIKKSIEAICAKAALPVLNKGDSQVFRFPELNDLADDFFDDSFLGLGYRSEYLRDFCKFLRNNPNWLENIKELSYEDALYELKKIKGIGDKVANCICLFGLHHIGAFPIDTHIRHILTKYYPNGFNYSAFDDCKGIVQQYMFYYEREKN